MQNIFADEFRMIPTVLEHNTDLRNAVIALIKNDHIAGKVTEGQDRLIIFKDILTQLVNGVITLKQAYDITELKLPEKSSTHAGNGRVFARGWAERHVRTQLSRFYNQAVLEYLISTNNTKCIVPHSVDEKQDSECTRILAADSNLVDVHIMYSRLISTYREGDWNKDLKIPHHPHCTHVIKPLDK
jgi:hypothetical protein